MVDLEDKLEAFLSGCKKRKLILLLLLLAVLALAGVSFFMNNRQTRTIQNNGSPMTDGGWKLVWSDEFDGEHLDKTVWTQEVREDGWYNDELQYYTGREENISFRDGALVITAKYDPNGGKRMYTSARISTQNKLHFQYGRIEARIQLPQGQGMWPAFWMLGTASDGQWPDCGEVDILEAVNNAQECNGFLHWRNNDSSSKRLDKWAGGGTPLEHPEQWHIYALEWTRTEMRWYLDDTCFYTHVFDTSDADQKVFLQPFYLLINLAVGGNFPGKVDDSIFPKEYCIDYVRVYTREQRP